MTVAMVLASGSPSRRRVLLQAGVNPNISVSHVDEPAALEDAASRHGATVEDLSAKQRVAILAKAKARTVAQSYHAVAGLASDACGDQVTAYPLRAVGEAQAAQDGRRNVAEGAASEGAMALGSHGDALSAIDGAGARTGADVQSASGKRAGGATPVNRTLTRDFSGVDVPTETVPLSQAMAGVHGFESSKVGPLIVGCDSMFLFEGEALGKPHTVPVARERLRAMRGKSGELWTGHCVIDFATGRELSATSHATVKFADYTDRQIESYVATGEPLEVAGCFTLEGLGGAFIESIEGDPSGVLGISLPLLRRMVAELDVDWTDLWNWDGASDSAAVAASAATGSGTDTNAGLGTGSDAGVDSTGDAATASGPKVGAADTTGAGAQAGSANVRADSGSGPSDASYPAKTGVDFGSRPPKNPSSLESRMAAVTSPQGNIRQPGDGWVECACGRRHWGRCGAAGVLLARRSEKTGKITDIMMQHRAVWSAEGGTWGVPGGAIGAIETPIEGALREAYEEADITPDDVEVVGTHREEHGPWAYTTVIAFEKPGHSVNPHPNDDESLKIGWVPVESVAGLKLLTAFRTDWPGFTRRLDALAAEYVGR